MFVEVDGLHCIYAMRESCQIRGAAAAAARSVGGTDYTHRRRHNVVVAVVDIDPLPVSNVQWGGHTLSHRPKNVVCGRLVNWKYANAPMSRLCNSQIKVGGACANGLLDVDDVATIGCIRHHVVAIGVSFPCRRKAPVTIIVLGGALHTDDSAGDSAMPSWIQVGTDAGLPTIPDSDTGCPQSTPVLCPTSRRLLTHHFPVSDT